MAWLATGKIGFLVPMAVALRWTALVQHNHSHLSVFRRPAMNRVLELSVGMVTGMPMELYREAHCRTHHRHLGTPLDWTQPTAVLDGRAVQACPVTRRRNLFLFVPRAGALGWAAVRRDPTQRRRLFGECAAIAALVALPLLSGSLVRLMPVVVLWVVVAVVSADANYKHHDGYLAAVDPTDFSNDSFSLLHTTLGFNIGYHTAHHRRPSAHWSKLAGLSASGGCRPRTRVTSF